MLKDRKSHLLISFLLIFLALFTLNSKKIATVSRNSLIDFNSAGLKALDGISKSVKRIAPFASLREENRILRARTEILTRRIHEAELFRYENERLRGLLDFKKTAPYTSVAAQVIGRDPTNWSNSLIIDKGLMHGVRQNMAILSPNGVVGRVLEIGRYSSKILLITDTNSKVGVVIERTREGGVLVGRPDGKCKMIYIALDSDVLPGDKVITAGLGSVFPKNIPVGEIAKVGKEPGRLYKYAIVKPAENLSRLEVVLCIK